MTIQWYIQKSMEFPRKMTFSFQIFIDYSISCYEGYTKVAYNNIVNSFTHRSKRYYRKI